ncbi:hypothetical protein GW17_00039493, partial [Ensete ventricosum]
PAKRSVAHAITFRHHQFNLCHNLRRHQNLRGQQAGEWGWSRWLAFFLIPPRLLLVSLVVHRVVAVLSRTAKVFSHSPPYKLGIPLSLLYRLRSSPFLVPLSSSSFRLLLQAIRTNPKTIIPLFLPLLSDATTSTAGQSAEDENRELQRATRLDAGGCKRGEASRKPSPAARPYAGDTPPCGQYHAVSAHRPPPCRLSPVSLSPPPLQGPGAVLQPPGVKDDDVVSVVEALVSMGRRSLVVVGECSDTIDAVVRGVIDRVDRGEVPVQLRNAEFITLPLFSFRHMSRGEVDHKVAELRCLLRSCCVGRGVVLYLGNLTWISQYRVSSGEKETSPFCPVEHAVMEISSLVCEGVGVESSSRSCRVLEDPCRRWNSMCSSAVKSQHKPSDPTFNFSSASPCDSSSSSISSYDQCPPSLHQNQQHWLLQLEVTDPCNGYQFRSSESTEQGFERDSRSSIPYVNLDSNPNSSASSSTMEMEYIPKFKELNAENLKILCSALEQKVPWQQEIIPEIASSILQCRAGMTKRKEKSRSNYENKEETWLFFQGGDGEAKKRVAKELASLVFCSKTNFVSISLSSISSPHSNSRKRFREDASHGHLRRLYEAINENPHRVIFIEDTEQADYHTQAGIKTVIERGRVRSYGGEEVGVSDAIIILSCKSFFNPPAKYKASKSDDGKEVKLHLPLDLNHCASSDDDDGGVDDVLLPEMVDRAFCFELPEDL